MGSAGELGTQLPLIGPFQSHTATGHRLAAPRMRTSLFRLAPGKKKLESSFELNKVALKLVKWLSLARQRRAVHCASGLTGPPRSRLVHVRLALPKPRWPGENKLSTCLLC